MVNKREIRVNKMARTQGEKIATMESDIGYIKVSVDDLKDIIKEHIIDEKEWRQTLDNRYASKKLEKLAWGAGAVTGATVLGAFITFIIKGGLI